MYISHSSSIKSNSSFKDCNLLVLKEDKFNEVKDEFEEFLQLSFKENIARMSGNFFVHNNTLYRPTQDCSEKYGGKLNIKRIVKLDKQSFAEETVDTIE